MKSHDRVSNPNSNKYKAETNQVGQVELLLLPMTYTAPLAAATLTLMLVSYYACDAHPRHSTDAVRAKHLKLGLHLYIYWKGMQLP